MKTSLMISHVRLLGKARTLASQSLGKELMMAWNLIHVEFSEPQFPQAAHRTRNREHET
jgi:hypothetical protein